MTIVNTLTKTRLLNLLTKLSIENVNGTICPYCETVYDERFDGCKCGEGIE